jgi:hypothetical protein
MNADLAAEGRALMTSTDSSSLWLPEGAPARTKATLAVSDAARALQRAGTRFLVYDPELVKGDAVLLAFQFAWSDDSPTVSAICTSGLCQAPQLNRRAWCFERFELVVAFYSGGFSEALFRQLLLLTRDVREWLANASHPAFGIGDWIAHFPLLAGQPSALLAPPAPELVQAGLHPSTQGSSDLPMRDWLKPDALLRAGSTGFLQAVPLFASEYEHVAANEDGFGFFLEHLVASDTELAEGKDPAFRILDMQRRPIL